MLVAYCRTARGCSMAKYVPPLVLAAGTAMCDLERARRGEAVGWGDGEGVGGSVLPRVPITSILLSSCLLQNSELTTILHGVNLTDR